MKSRRRNRFHRRSKQSFCALCTRRISWIYFIVFWCALKSQSPLGGGSIKFIDAGPKVVPLATHVSAFLQLQCCWFSIGFFCWFPFFFGRSAHQKCRYTIHIVQKQLRSDPILIRSVCGLLLRLWSWELAVRSRSRWQFSIKMSWGYVRPSVRPSVWPTVWAD